MTERQIKLQIVEKADVIAKVLTKGKDCELRKSAGGVSIHSVERRKMQC